MGTLGFVILLRSLVELYFGTVTALLFSQSKLAGAADSPLHRTLQSMKLQ